MYAAHAAALLACGSQAPLAQLSGSAAQRMLLEVAFSVEFAPAAIGLDPALHRLFQLCSREASKVSDCKPLTAGLQLGLQAGRLRAQSAVHAACFNCPSFLLKQETWWCMIGHEQREQGQRLAALLASGSYLDQMLLTGGQARPHQSQLCTLSWLFRAVCCSSGLAWQTADAPGTHQRLHARGFDVHEVNIQELSYSSSFPTAGTVGGRPQSSAHPAISSRWGRGYRQRVSCSQRQQQQCFGSGGSSHA